MTEEERMARRESRVKVYKDVIDYVLEEYSLDLSDFLRAGNAGANMIFLAARKVLPAKSLISEKRSNLKERGERYSPALISGVALDLAWLEGRLESCKDLLDEMVWQFNNPDMC